MNEIGKALPASVVGRRRHQNQRLAFGGQKLRQISPLTACIGDDMALVNNDDVPVRFFDVVPKLGVVFQCINGNNGFVVVFKRVFVGGQFGFYLGNAEAVQSYERNGEAIPKFLLKLKLPQNGLEGEHHDAFAASALDHFGQKDARFDGFA